MSENVPAISPTQDLALLTEQQLALIKNTIARGATDDELALFLQVAQATDLSPFTRPPEIYFVKYTMRNGSTSVSMPVGIDGLRRKAAESGDYAGQAGPFWCAADAVWKDLWISDDPPFAAKVGVYRYGPDGKVNPKPTWGVVKWSEFAKDITKPAGMFWKKMGAHMLAKCAEAQAFRKGCPRLMEKMQAAGAQVIDAAYLIYKAEQIQRQQALPHRVPPTDLHEDLYGQSAAGQSEADQTAPGVLDGEGQSEEQKPAKWSEDDVAKLKRAIEERDLSSKEWRKLLGLPEETIVGDLVALGSVDHVIALLMKALDVATTGEVDTKQAVLF